MKETAQPAGNMLTSYCKLHMSIVQQNLQTKHKQEFR